MGIGGWGLGLWAQTPNPQSQIPNPQRNFKYSKRFFLAVLYYLNYLLLFDYKDETAEIFNITDDSTRNQVLSDFVDRSKEWVNDVKSVLEWVPLVK